MKIVHLALLISLFFTVNSFASDKYIVKFKNNKTLKSMKNLRQFGVVNPLSVSFGSFAILNSEQKLDIEALKEDPNVEYIEKSVTYRAIELNKRRNDMNDIVDDPKVSKQWALLNDGKNSRMFIVFKGKAGEDINAMKAWTVSKGSRDIKVAVIDTGINYKHEDLKNQMWTNEVELNGKPGVDDDNNGYIDDIHGYDFANNDADPMDDHGHGSHCAGVIGAEHNRKGIAGVMANVQLVALKFLSRNGSGDTIGAIKAVDYAIKAGVKVISNSYGGGENSKAFKEAIQAANDAGIVFVAAAGNESSNNDSSPTWPASYKVDNVITVGAMTGNGKKASYSNYGKESVHIFAPGSRILSTVLKNKYKKMDGTSMACPNVAGVAGLLLSHENLTPLEVKERIIKTAVDNGSLSGYGKSKGRIDAYRVLQNIQD